MAGSIDKFRPLGIPEGKFLNYANASSSETASNGTYLGVWGLVQVALNIAGFVFMSGIIMADMRPNRFEEAIS